MMIGSIVPSEVVTLIIEVLLTTFVCFFCIFFGYGGIQRRKLFWKLCKRKGPWRMQWLGIGLWFVLLACYAHWLFGWSRSFVNLMLLASYLTAVTITDLRARDIPDDATVFYAVLFLLWLLTSGERVLVFQGLLGAFVGAAIPFAIYFVRHDAIGFGDIKLLGCIGLLTGCPGIMFVLLRAMVFGAIFSIGLLLCKKGTMKTELPFAPFVLLAACI